MNKFNENYNPPNKEDNRLNVEDKKGLIRMLLGVDPEKSLDLDALISPSEVELASIMGVQPNELLTTLYGEPEAILAHQINVDAVAVSEALLQADNSVEKTDLPPENQDTDTFLPRDFYQPMLPKAGKILSKDAEKKALFDSDPSYKGMEPIFDYGFLWTPKNYMFITLLLLDLRKCIGLHFTVDYVDIFLPTFKGNPKKVALYRGRPVLPLYSVRMGTQFNNIYFSVPWVAEAPGCPLEKLYLIFRGDGTVRLSINPECLENERIWKEYVCLSVYVQDSCRLIQDGLSKKPDFPDD